MAYVYGQDARTTEEAIQTEDTYVKAILLSNKGKRKEAILVLDTLRRELQQPEAQVFFLLAKLHYDDKNLAQCETYLQQALKAAPENVWYIQYAFTVYRETGRSSDAMQMADRLIGLEPQREVWIDAKIDWLVEERMYTEALTALTAKEKQFGFSTSTALRRVTLYQKTGETDKALADVNALMTKYPDDKKYPALGAALLHEAGRVSESKPYLEAILRIDTSDPSAQTGLSLLSRDDMTEDDFLASLLTLAGNDRIPLESKLEDILPYLRKQSATGDSVLGGSLERLGYALSAAHPGDARAHAVCADILKNNGKYGDAIVSYRKSLSLTRRVYAVWEQLLYCLDQMGETISLAETAGEAIDYFPTQVMPYLFRALAHIRSAEFPQAESLLSDVEMIGSGNAAMESRICAVRGAHLFARKDVAAAEEQADKALTLSQEQNADALELKGDILAAKGQKPAAVTYWKKALAIQIYSPRIQRKLQ